MKKFLILFFLLTFFVSFSSVCAFAGEVSFKWWKNPKIVEELNLSQGQVNRIEEIFSYYREHLVELNSRLRLKEAEYRDKSRDPNSNREEIQRLFDEVQQIKGQLENAELNMFLQIREVLTPQQRAKLHEIKGRYKRPPN